LRFEVFTDTVYNYIFWSYRLVNVDLIFDVSDDGTEAIASNTLCTLTLLIGREDFMVPMFLLISGT
jgi:hypothetical protein